MTRVTQLTALLALSSPALGLIERPNFHADASRIKALQAGGALQERDFINSVPAEYVASPYYPTPLGGWSSSWTAAYAKAAKVVANMTLAEKVNLTTGTGELMGPCVGQTGSALRFGVSNFFTSLPILSSRYNFLISSLCISLKF